MIVAQDPGSLKYDEARQKLRSLLNAGVSVFIDLTEEGELEPYADILNDEADRLGISAQHQRMSITDQGVPTVEAMVSTLNDIDEALESGQLFIALL